MTGIDSCGSPDYDYDDHGNMEEGRGKTMTYSHYDKPTKIAKINNQNGEYTDLYYGTSRSRYLRVDKVGGVTTRTAYIGNLEIITKSSGGGTQTRRNMPGAVINDYSNGSSEINFLHKDHLGSLNTITNGQGEIVSKVAFDAWGKRILIPKSDWNEASKGKAILTLLDLSGVLAVTTRGYTGHEHIDNMDIIHMNGRIYDPTLGRFLQADPFVQAPNNSQSFNRYTYVLNSPLSYTDPSGYIFDSIMKPIKGFIRSVARALGPTLSSIGSGFACLGNPVCIGYLQYNIARAHGATSGSALKGAFTAAASAFAFQQIGGLDDITQTTRVMLHGTVGGISSVLQGGKFGHGFLSAGLTKLLNVNEIIGTSQVWGMDSLRVVTAAIIGGSISKISGGKFSNGAVTAAFGQMFNGNGQADIDQAKKDFKAKYGAIIKAAGIDIEQNVKDAKILGKNLDVDGFIKKVESSGEWDYKVNTKLVGVFSESLLDEFGNVHFGIVANAAGFNLEGSLYGAGYYQVHRQGGGHPADLRKATVLLALTNGGYTLADPVTIKLTNDGFTWGDNTGDAINIMNGWIYGENVYGD